MAVVSERCGNETTWQIVEICGSCDIILIVFSASGYVS